MQNEPYGEVKTVRPGRLWMWLVAATFVTLACIGLWLLPNNETERGARGVEDESTIAVAPEPALDNAVGTTGTSAGSEMAGQAGGVAPELIQEIETITARNDGHGLIGHRVNLRVPIREHVNDVAFWVGPEDNRVLVVMARDTRDGRARQIGRSSEHGIAPLEAGQHAVISGSVQQVPRAEEMASWGLTHADRSELAERRIYIRADTVRPAAVTPGA